MWFSVKKIKKASGGTGNDLVEKELDKLQKLADHPHIIAVKELLHDNKNYYIVTEICEGGELFTHL